MSTEGNVNACHELRGTIHDPLKIHGKSAYELAVMHGFDGTEEEWLESLHADWDERADDAKASIDAEVDNVIVPEAKAELERAKAETVADAVAEIGVAEGKSAQAIEQLTEDSETILKNAAAMCDEKEVLLWENSNIGEVFASGTIDTISGNIPSDVERLRLVFYDRVGTVVGGSVEPSIILPSVEVERGQSGRICFAEGSTTAKAYSRFFEVYANGNVKFEGADPNNGVCIPYKIYGVKNTEINIVEAIDEFLDDLLVQEVGDSEEKVMSQKATTEAIDGLSDELVKNLAQTAGYAKNVPMSQKAVTDEIYMTGKNLFNKDDDGIVADAAMQADGTLYYSKMILAYVSGFIPVEAGKTYVFNHAPDQTYYTAFYDETHALLRAVANEHIAGNDNTVTAPEDACYMRFTGMKGYEGTQQIELGYEATSYEPYEFVNRAKALYDVATAKELQQALTDIATAKTDIASAKTDIAKNKTDIATAQTDIATAKTNIATAQTDITRLSFRMGEAERNLGIYSPIVTVEPPAIKDAGVVIPTGAKRYAKILKLYGTYGIVTYESMDQVTMLPDFPQYIWGGSKVLFQFPVFSHFSETQYIPRVEQINALAQDYGMHADNYIYSEGERWFYHQGVRYYDDYYMFDEIELLDDEKELVGYEFKGGFLVSLKKPIVTDITDKIGKSPFIDLSGLSGFGCKNNLGNRTITTADDIYYLSCGTARAVIAFET